VVDAPDVHCSCNACLAKKKIGVIMPRLQLGKKMRLEVRDVSEDGGWSMSRERADIVDGTVKYSIYGRSRGCTIV